MLDSESKLLEGEPVGGSDDPYELEGLSRQYPSYYRI
jgi:hypothetical protein